jgi:hypothetical protein
MNRKQLLLVITLAVLIGGLGWWVSRRDAASYQASGAELGKKLLPDFPLNDVSRVVIAEGTNQLELVKENDVWQVRPRYGYPANFSELGDLIRKLWGLKVLQSETVGDSDLARLQVLGSGDSTNSGTRLELANASGKSLATLVLGKKHMRKGAAAPSQFGGDEGFPDGRWLRVLGDARDKKVFLVAETLTEVEPKPDRWLDKEFIKIEKIKSVEVTPATNAAEGWKLVRELENGELKLVDPREGEKLDTGKSAPVGNVLSWPSFVDVLNPQVSAADLGLEHPSTARIETFEGLVYLVKVGTKNDQDNYPVQVTVEGAFAKERVPGQDEKPEDKEKLDKEFKERLTKLEEKLKREQAAGKWTYLISKWTVDPLLKTRHELLVEKKDDAKANTPATPPTPFPSTNEPPEPDLSPLPLDDEGSK